MSNDSDVMNNAYINEDDSHECVDSSINNIEQYIEQTEQEQNNLISGLLGEPEKKITSSAKMMLGGKNLYVKM